MNGSRSNSGNLPRGHADPDTAPANGDAEIGVTGDDRPSHAGSEFGIVNRFGRVRADVDELMARLGQMALDFFLEKESSMVRAEGKPHWRRYLA